MTVVVSVHILTMILIAQVGKRLCDNLILAIYLKQQKKPAFVLYKLKLYCICSAIPCLQELLLRFRIIAHFPTLFNMQINIFVTSQWRTMKFQYQFSML